MAAASTFRILARELALVFAPLKNAVGGVDEFRSFIARLGWVVDSLPPSYQALSPHVDQALASVRALADDPDPGEVLNALEKLRQLVATIRSLSEAPAGVDAAAFVDDVREALVELLLVDYLAARQPLLYRLLSVTGVIQEEVHEAEGNRPPFVKSRFRFEEIPRLLDNPSLVPERVYGWGTPDLDMRRITSDLLELFSALGLAVQIAEIDRERQDGYQPDPEDADHSMSLMLVVPLFEKIVAAKSVQAGFALLELPAEAGKPPGLIVEPFVPSEVGSSFSISDNLTLAIRAGSDIAATFGLLIRPGEVGVRYPFEPGHPLPSAGFGMALRYAPSSTSVLVGRPSGTRLQIAGAETSLAVNTIGAEMELVASIETIGLWLVIAAADPDAFVGEVLGGQETEIPFPLGLRWSSKTGLGFQGGALAATVWPNRSIGPIRVDTLSIALHGEEPQGEASRGVLEVGAGLSGAFGPVAFTIEGAGLRMIVAFEDGNLGPIDVDLGFKTPTGVGLVIDASVVVGGGYLFFDAQKEEYRGILQLEIAETIAVKAVGLLTTRMPDGSKGYSLVVMIWAQGFAPIQLGFGFTVTGIGGLLGINRTAMVDVLRSGLKNGTLSSILFPDDPTRNAPQIVSDLRAVFPPVKDRYVFGPMAIISWGTPAILTLEIGLILELPEPVRLIILGRLRAVLPDEEHALVQVRMDAIGVIDFNKEEVSLDATLYDSRILQFVLTGDMALRANWGAQPNFVLAIGGFNPRFPAPAGFPQLARLALSLGDSDNPRLRLESYLALTSNTVQFGARLDFSYSAAGFTLAGLLGFDALFQFAPFEFIADVGAMVALKRGNSVLMGLFLDITLAGPTPWHVWGKATFKVLIFKVSIRFDHRFGHEEPPALPEPIDVLTLLAEALGDRRNWSSALPRGEHPIVSLRDSATTPATLRVHPLAELTVRQRVVPLNRPVTRFGNAPLAGGTTTFTVAASSIDNPSLRMTSTMVRDAFALAQYQEMSDEEKLARPAFETQDAGLQFGVEEAAYQYEALTDTAISYETLIIDPTRPAEKQSEPYVLPQPVLDAVVILGAAGQAAIRRSGSSRYRTLERAA
jgi:hypothetical protein